MEDLQAKRSCPLYSAAITVGDEQQTGNAQDPGRALYIPKRELVMEHGKNDESKVWAART